MESLIILLVILVYVTIGCIAEGLLREDSDTEKIGVILFWPIIWVGYVFLGFFSFCIGMGEKIRKEIEKHGG